MPWLSRHVASGFALILGGSIACLFVLGCCSGGQHYLNVSVGESNFQTSPNWGETGPAQGTLLVVSYVEERSLAGDPLEFYFGGASVDVPVSMTIRDNRAENGCGTSHVWTYDMSQLPPGSYTVVHRRSSGTGDPMNCGDECPWVDFEGEDALVMVMEF